MKPLSTKHLILISILMFILILGGTVFFMLSCWPSGISVDRDNNVNLAVMIGEGRRIPADEITVSAVPDGLLSHLIRTSGLSLGKINYGRFKKSGQKMFLYLTGREEKVCFEYDGLLYVVDDWRTGAR